MSRRIFFGNKTGGVSGPKLLSPLTGAIVLSGKNVNLNYRRAYVMPATSGAIVLSGKPVVLTYQSLQKILVALPGTIALAGRAATLHAGRNVSAGSGEIVLGGTAAVLRVGRMATAPAKERTVYASAEDRIRGAATEYRTVIVPAEFRRVVVPAKRQAVDVAREIREQLA